MNRDTLAENSLELALGAVVSVEARARASGVIANTSTRAVSTSLVTESLERIWARGAFQQRAIRTTATQITDASDVLLSIPRSRVNAGSLGGELLFREAHTSITARIRANSTLASNSVVVSEAGAFTSLAIANTLI